jgi:hypothetical protein
VTPNSTPVVDPCRTIRAWTDCQCSCHPRLLDGDLHDHGFDCPCQHTAEQREAAVRVWMASVDQFWASPEGLRLTAAQEAEAAERALTRHTRS